MNARRVLCAVCVLVVGLLLVLERPALAGPPGAPLYWLGERPVYGPGGGPVAPKPDVPAYRVYGYQAPGLYGNWGNANQQAPNLLRLWPYPTRKYVAPQVPVPQYQPNYAGPPWQR